MYPYVQCAWMTGKHAEMQEVPTWTVGDAYASGAHGKEEMWVVGTL